MDERALTLLKTLVERYIADGQPVGSRTLSRASGLELSAATVRNVMADLEEMGLIASPHTSAGRIPTTRGYRVFVDTMLTAQPRDLAPEQSLDRMREQAIALDRAREQIQPDQPQRVIAQAATLLSSLSQFVGVVVAPRRAGIVRHIEFLRLGERRVLVILVTPDGGVQNRVIFTARDQSQEQLAEASRMLNQHYVGLTIDAMRSKLRAEVDQLRADIAALMQAAVEAGGEALADEQEQVVVSGERNLLQVQDFGHDMGALRKAFDLFERKADLVRLLDTSSSAEGVKIYIGGESGIVPTQDLSIVSAPYEIDGQVVGTLGVIGPTRMAYDRMIQLVDITARLVGSALSGPK